MAPEDVIWANLGMNPYEQKVHFGCSFPLCFVNCLRNFIILPPFSLVIRSLHLVRYRLAVERCRKSVSTSSPPLIILFHVTLELTIFITDTYSYQLLDNRCLNHFLVFPRYVLSRSILGYPCSIPDIHYYPLK